MHDVCANEGGLKSLVTDEEKLIGAWVNDSKPSAQVGSTWAEQSTFCSQNVFGSIICISTLKREKRDLVLNHGDSEENSFICQEVVYFEISASHLRSRNGLCLFEDNPIHVCSEVSSVVFSRSYFYDCSLWWQEKCTLHILWSLFICIISCSGVRWATGNSKNTENCNFLWAAMISFRIQPWAGWILWF